MFFKTRKKNNKVLVLTIKEYKRRGGGDNMGVISASTNFCISPPEEIKSDS